MNSSSHSTQVNPVENKYSEVFLAWLAGFLDGDGAIMARVVKQSGMLLGFRVRVVLQFTQLSLQSMLDLQALLGMGIISQGGAVSLVILEQAHVALLLSLMLPHIRFKRNQAVLALEILEKKSRAKGP